MAMLIYQRVFYLHTDWVRTWQHEHQHQPIMGISPMYIDSIRQHPAASGLVKKLGTPRDALKGQNVFILWGIWKKAMNRKVIW